MVNKSLLIGRESRPTKDLSSLNPEIANGIFIVTGAQGNLGQRYLQTVTERLPQAQIYGLHRRPLMGDEVPGVTYRQADLGYRKNVDQALEGVAAHSGQRITLIHTVGMFRYEPEGTPPAHYDRDGDVIDDDIYRSNVITTRNVVAALLNTHPTNAIGITAFSSIIKEHRFPHFGSYDRAKAIMEKDLQQITEVFPHVSVVVLNVPTLNTPAEHEIRPFAQQSETWLQPQLLVDHSLEEILSLGIGANRGYREIDIYTECPDFDLERFRETHAGRWLAETGIGQVGGRRHERV